MSRQTLERGEGRAGEVKREERRTRGPGNEMEEREETKDIEEKIKE